MNKLIIREAKITYRKVGVIEKLKCITNQKTAYEVLKPSFKPFVHQEAFIALYLNSQNLPICKKVITTGTINSTQISLHGIYETAILCGATGIIVAHNHPSGNLKPSQEDLNITKKLIEAGKIMNINLLDHLIITDFSFNSLRDTTFVFD